MKGNTNRQEAHHLFQKDLLKSLEDKHYVGKSPGLYHGIYIIHDFIHDSKNRSVFEAALKGNWELFRKTLLETRPGIESKEARRITLFYKHFFQKLRKTTPAQEFKTIPRLFFEPDFLEKNQNQLQTVVRTCSKLYSRIIPAKGEKSLKDLFQYELLMVLDPETSHKTRLQLWAQLRERESKTNGLKPLLGVVVLTKNPEEMLGKILTSTAKKPEARVPIFNREGKQIWPTQAAKK